MSRRKPRKGKAKVAVRKPMPPPQRAHRDRLARALDKIWHLLRDSRLDD
jgi:hypothetical protein